MAAPSSNSTSQGGIPTYHTLREADRERIGSSNNGSTITDVFIGVFKLGKEILEIWPKSNNPQKKQKQDIELKKHLLNNNCSPVCGNPLEYQEVIDRSSGDVLIEEYKTRFRQCWEKCPTLNNPDKKKP